MAALAEKLTFPEFRSKYERGDRSYVIATSIEIEHPYPTKAVVVANPEGRQIFRWTGSALELSNELTSIPASRIWQELDQAPHRRQ